MHVSSLGSRITIYPVKKTQIAFLLAEKVIILAEYSDFADVFSEKSADVSSKRIRVNEHTMNLKKGKQLPYKLI